MGCKELIELEISEVVTVGRYSNFGWQPLQTTLRLKGLREVVMWRMILLGRFLLLQS